MESGSELWPGSPIVVEVLSLAIDLLLPHEVFVFGSNGDGFHGAGAAGLACRGDAANTWRQDEWFNKAMEAPMGDPARVGRWAVFGVARGFQMGRSGCSYAVQTIDRPRRRRSTSRREIYHQLVELVSFARSRPDLSFVVTPLGEGYSGYSREEMAVVWRELHARVGIPDTFRFIRLGSRAQA
jgi:hypothetical protein